MSGLIAALNGPWHKRAMQVFLVIVLGHWAEHILQAIQVFVLHWPRPEARGALGMVFPWLVTSETLHYGYAVVMLIGLLLLRPAFVGRGRTWWNVALGIQVWHHFEHLLLLVQAITGHYFFGMAQPTSILQLVFPRVELHLFYNAVVFAPMMAAMWFHMFPTRGERRQTVCTCALERRADTVASPA